MKSYRLLVPLLVVVASGCASIRTADAPSLSSTAGFASQYWFRGTPQSQRGVAQGDITAAVPLKTGTLGLSTWGNVQLEEDTGGAIFVNKNGGKFSEIDISASYSQSVDDFNLTGGVISYNFPNANGPSTAEVFGSAAHDLLGLTHTLTLYYDFDNLDGFYGTFSSAKSFQLAKDVKLDVNAMLGYMSAAQAEFYFGDRHAGLSDLSANAAVTWAVDEKWSLFCRLSGVTVLDSNLKDALDANNFDHSGTWIAIGSAWSF